MCGFAGLIAKSDLSKDRFTDFIKSSELMKHRGPDNQGIFMEENVLLIHYRLSILDLDNRSNQPFFSKSDKSVCVYNGEIYNFKELAKQYNLNTSTTSDTEVMIELFELRGVLAVPEWNGIFSAVIYDRNEEKIHFIRDRIGVKPFYIYEDDDVILFASEAKVILDWLPSFRINSLGLSQYLWFGNTTGKQTIVKGLNKLNPATILSYSTNTFKITYNKQYWNISTNTFSNNLNEQETIIRIREKLESAVKRQLVSDVPLGVLLSGGIDSSSVVAFASRHFNGKLDTYTVAYDYNINSKNELENARKVSKKFNTNHHELVVTSDNVKEIFNDLVFQHDEPFAEAANVPLYQLAKLCSKDKKVILQGDGGDELFAGYRRYNVLNSFDLWKSISKMYFLIPSAKWKERIKRISFILNQSDHGKIMAYYLSQEVPYECPYQVLNTDIKKYISQEPWATDYLEAAELFKEEKLVQKMLKTDATILLPHTYLEKVDKPTMRFSLEARVPYLDNELIDLAYSIPSDLKVKKNQKKYLLKKSLEGLIPDEILYGPKKGFDTPIGNWLRNDLYEYAKDTFLNKQNDLLDSNICLDLLEKHKKYIGDNSFLLWKTLVLFNWLHIYRSKYKIQGLINSIN